MAEQNGNLTMSDSMENRLTDFNEAFIDIQNLSAPGGPR